jgi:tetratricopeptide (TPR) repeat protein
VVEKQFAQSTKHLFRHLHDPEQLRRNPIVRRFFDDPTIGGFGAARDRAVLARIHQVIREATDYHRDTSLRAGERNRALRQHTIVMRQCFGGASVPSVAADLGISANLCYRERARICRRIAGYVLSYSGTPALQYFPDIDPFDAQVDRVVRIATCGEMAASLHACDALIQAAESLEQRLNALCVSASVHLHFGRSSRARRALDEAKRLSRRHGSDAPSPLWALTLAQITNAEAQLAHFLGDTWKAAELAQSAADRLRAILAVGPNNAYDLYAECLNFLAGALWNLGDSERAYDAFVDAEASLQHARRPEHVAHAVSVQAWRVRNRLLMSSKTWYPAWRRIQALQHTFEGAYRSGATIQAIEALEGLTEIYTFGGNGTEAMRNGRLALALAYQQASPVVKHQTLLTVAQLLLRTHHAEYALALLTDAERSDRGDAVLRRRLSCVAAERAIQLGRFDEAWQLATAHAPPEAAAELGLRKRVVAVRSAHALGLLPQAASGVELLIPLAERFGSAPVLLDAYTIAARVTSKREFSKKATEIINLLAA